MSKDKFLKGALILAIAGLIVKALGAVGKVLLVRIIGAEAYGLYAIVYPLYLIVMTLASAGVPSAIAIIIAEKIAIGDRYGAKRVFNISFNVLFILGAILSVIMYFSAQWAIDFGIIRDDRAYYAVLVLAPAVLFVTLEAVYRGYFQGYQQMMPTGVSQFVEQLFRIVFVLVAAYIGVNAFNSMEYRAAGASLGALPGAIAGVIVLMVYYYSKRRDDGIVEKTHVVESAACIVKRTVKLAFPVALANIMLPIVTLLDAVIVPFRLETAGFSVAQATTLFGYLSMAVPLIAGVSVLTGALATSLVPAVSEARVLGHIEEICLKTARAYNISNLITIPAFCGLWLLGTPIAMVLYKDAGAAWAISTTAIGMVFLGLQQVSTGTLQGLGKTAIPFISMVISAVVKVIITWIFTAIPGINIIGAAWASNFDLVIAAVLNMIFIYKYTGFGIVIGKTFKILIASAIMGGIALGSYNLFMQLFHGRVIHSCFIAMIIACVVYVVAVLIIGAISGKDIESIPKLGKPFADKLRKLKIVRD